MRCGVSWTTVDSPGRAAEIFERRGVRYIAIRTSRWPIIRLGLSSPLRGSREPCLQQGALQAPGVRHATPYSNAYGVSGPCLTLLSIITRDTTLVLAHRGDKSGVLKARKLTAGSGPNQKTCAVPKSHHGVEGNGVAGAACVCRQRRRLPERPPQKENPKWVKLRVRCLPELSTS